LKDALYERLKGRLWNLYIFIVYKIKVKSFSGMKKLYITIILMMMVTEANSQCNNSGFFNDKSDYTVYLQTKASYPLSKKDSRTLIDILSSYEWEEKKGKQEITIEEIKGGGWQYYHYYIYDYYISISHPNGRTVRIRINSGGIGQDDFVIEAPNGKMYGTLRIKDKLSQDDIKKIKHLFLNNVSDFNSISFKEGEKIKIVLTFSFYFAFPYLELSAIYLDEDNTKEFIRLYNTAWNNDDKSGGGTPLPTLYLNNQNNIISYLDNVLPSEDSFNALELKEENRYALTRLISNALQGHNGTGEKELGNQSKLVYQYRNGVLDGTTKVYSPDGSLISELKYDNGFPVDYIIYSPLGEKIKEFHFDKGNTFATWIEYEKDGKIKREGKSYYSPFYHSHKDINKFYDGE